MSSLDLSSLDLSNPALALSFLPTPLSVIQLRPSQAVPQALLAALAGNGGLEAPAFVSLTRTPKEKSIILPTELFQQLYPPSAPEQPHETSGPWSTLIIAGPLDLSLSGILHELTGPLKKAGVPIFASSTWDTDYVLINKENEETARNALEEAGWKFTSS
ncbi:hypothetical protein JCM8547_006796 [Rhodosporidiobolus lusitaniae]